MKITCPFCTQKARIYSNLSLNDARTVVDLYCQCTDAQQCGATFVYTLAYKHVINPPANTVSQLAINLVNRLSKEERAALQQAMLAGGSLPSQIQI